MDDVSNYFMIAIDMNISYDMHRNNILSQLKTIKRIVLCCICFSYIVFFSPNVPYMNNSENQQNGTIKHSVQSKRSFVRLVPTACLLVSEM